MHGTSYFLEVILLLAAAVVSVVVFQRLRLASVLGYLIAGALIGPHGFGLVGQVGTVRSIAELGVVFLLFTIGLELPLGRLRVLGAVMYGLGVAQIVVTAALAALVAVVAGLDTKAAIVVGGGIALSSTVFVVQRLLDRGELATRLGRTAFAVLLIQDLAVGPLLILVVALADDSMGLGLSLSLATLKAAGALAVMFFFGRVALRPIFRAVANARNTEVFAATSLLVVLCSALLANAVGLSLAFGGFLAGILLAETEYRHQVAAEIQPFRGLLLGLFFMSVGMSIDQGLALSEFGVVVALAAAVISGKAVILAGLAFAFGLPRRISLPLAALLPQGGEFAFVLLGIGMVQGIVPGAAGQILIVAIAVTMLLSPFLASLSDLLARRAGHSGEIGYELTADAADTLHDHVVIVGYGRVGRAIGLRLKAEGVAYVAVDLDADRVKFARARGDPVYFGDATRPEVLDAMNVGAADAVVVALRDPRATLQFIGLLHYLLPALPIYARAHDDAHAARLEDAGAVATVPELVATGDRLAVALMQGLGKSDEYEA